MSITERSFKILAALLKLPTSYIRWEHKQIIFLSALATFLILISVSWSQNTHLNFSFGWFLAVKNTV